MTRWLGLIVTGVLLAGATGCSNGSSGTTPVSSPQTAPAAQTIEAFGVTQPDQVMHIVIDFPARVEQVLVTEGQRVKKGDALVKFNLNAYNAQVTAKENEIIIAKNEPVGATISKAKTAIYEQELAILKAKTQRDDLNGDTLVSAYPDAVVHDIGYVRGDLVAPDRKVLTLSNVEHLIVKADVVEEFVKDVKVGAKVVIRPTADKSREYAGQVTRIGQMAFQTRNGETTVPVEVSINQQDAFLMPGFSVELQIAK